MIEVLAFWSTADIDYAAMSDRRGHALVARLMYHTSQYGSDLPIRSLLGSPAAFST